MSRVVFFRMALQDYARLEALCRAESRTVSDFARAAIFGSLNEYSRAAGTSPNDPLLAELSKISHHVARIAETVAELADKSETPPVSTD